MHLRLLPEKGKYKFRGVKMEMLVTKFSNGKYRNEGELFKEVISAENVKLMGEMIALQALRTVKKFDMKVADKLYIGLIKDLHHMNEIDYIVSDGYACCAVIDNIFIGLGNTGYNAINSLIINVVYYGTFYILYLTNTITFTMDVIIMMFGFGMVVHLAVSLIEEKLFLRKFAMKKAIISQ